MKRRLVAVTLSLIMTMATVSEAGAAAFTSPDTAPAVATQTDAEEVNVTEETSETEADAFSDGDDGTAVPSQEQTDDAFTAGTDTAAALPDETPSTADATDAVGAAVVKAEDWVSTENGFKLRKPAKNQDTANTDDQKAATAALPDEEMPSETDGFSGDQTESSETAVAETDTTAVTAEVTAMETPAATDTVSVTNEEFYTAADGIVKISTEYKGETHTGYYLFDEEGILVTGQAEVKEKSSADEEPTSDAAQSAGEDAAGEETEAQANQSYFTTADEAVVYTGCEGEAITPYTSTASRRRVYGNGQEHISSTTMRMVIWRQLHSLKRKQKQKVHIPDISRSMRIITASILKVSHRQERSPSQLTANQTCIILILQAATSPEKCSTMDGFAQIPLRESAGCILKREVFLQI